MRSMALLILYVFLAPFLQYIAGSAAVEYDAGLAMSPSMQPPAPRGLIRSFDSKGAETDEAIAEIADYICATCCMVEGRIYPHASLLSPADLLSALWHRRRTSDKIYSNTSYVVEILFRNYRNYAACVPWISYTTKFVKRKDYILCLCKYSDLLVFYFS
ncbi:hypothetical protein KP509_25G004500 [Ceratopteris richardii]|uniref:Uncharacterized protein n=1 Tax=Ceratopteris richardii TaxID=49495 RepID=A0A8T2RMF8_CERRI|nr:hypothetical protein KP509_25G004500 [Ceratopteris richardii]